MVLDSLRWYHLWTVSSSRLHKFTLAEMVFHQSAQFGFLPCLLVVFLDRLGVARTTFVEGYCPSFEIRGQEVLLAENSWIGLLGFKPFAPQGDALGFEFSSLWVTVPGVGLQQDCCVWALLTCFNVGFFLFTQCIGIIQLVFGYF